ncbi:hypothetical protein ACMBCM_04940 [Spiroplasma sp. K1]
MYTSLKKWYQKWNYDTIKVTNPYIYIYIYIYIYEIIIDHSLNN